MADNSLDISVHDNDLHSDQVQVMIGNPFTSDHGNPDMEPLEKKPRLCDPDPVNQSIKQLLFNINKAICLRLDALEGKMDQILSKTRSLEEKIQWINGESPGNNTLNSSSSVNNLHNNTSSCMKRHSPMVVGIPSKSSLSPSTSNSLTEPFGAFEPEKYEIIGPGRTDVVQKFYTETRANQNITLITLNSEDDYPNGTWLGDENNPEMRVRVNVLPSDLLHIHSNCRTAEKMALTLLDYLFDRETQACSNLSGLGKHGKKQLDPLLIYGIRCHLIHRFNINEQDWHRIKQNIDSKCRTAFRRKQRGLPLTVKAFRGKYGSSGLDLADMSSHSDEDSTQHDGELTISQVGSLDTEDNVVLNGLSHLSHSAGHVQVLHATPEQLAQLQQSHRIQILQGDQIIGHLTGASLSSDMQVRVSLPGGREAGLHIVGDTALISEDEDHIIKSEAV